MVLGGQRFEMVQVMFVCVNRWYWFEMLWSLKQASLSEDSAAGSEDSSKSVVFIKLTKNNELCINSSIVFKQQKRVVIQKGRGVF